MDTQRHVLSVGVDVGTTTTQVVFSRLGLAAGALPGEIPRVRIGDREVLFESRIVLTPLVDQETVDAPALARFLAEQYELAGVKAADVEAGAVIITGETARKRNADEILSEIAHLAGDFVVTVAGPILESVIAGRGSGVAAYSQKHFTTATAVDVGGGSANLATFKQGKVVRAAAMNVGGRIVQISALSGEIEYLAPPALAIVRHLDLGWRIGVVPTFEELRVFTDCLADLILELIDGVPSPLGVQLLLTEPGGSSARDSTVFFSGGVGYLYYAGSPVHSVGDVTRYGDVGPLFADALRRHPGIQALTVKEPEETVRATVLGASTHTLGLSGSTIWVDDGVLPLRNLPVVRASVEVGDLTPESFLEGVDDAARRWGVDPFQDDMAYAIAFDGPLDFSGLERVAQGFVSLADRRAQARRPLVGVVGRDYAQVIGQFVKASRPDQALVVIDQVGLEEGDYIDIGRPMLDGRVVPLVVKTLVFYE